MAEIKHEPTDALGAPETTLPGEVEGLVDAFGDAAIRLGRDQIHGDPDDEAGSSTLYHIARTTLLTVIRPGVGGVRQGASSSEDRALAEGEDAVPASSSLRDFDPSRITLEGIENLLWELSRDRDTEPQDIAIFREAWSRLQEYRPEARRIIFATHGHWSAWSEEELDSDPSDPLVGRTTEWFVGFWRTGEPEADTYVRTGSGRSAERIARELAADLNEMVSLVSRARDEQPKAENPKGLSPQGASRIDEVEAPDSDDDWALTIARRVAGSSIYDIAEALRHADACGHMRGHEAGEKVRSAPDATGGDGRRICEALGFDPTNHHNTLKCPYCNPDGLVLAPAAISGRDATGADGRRPFTLRPARRHQLKSITDHLDYLRGAIDAGLTGGDEFVNGTTAEFILEILIHHERDLRHLMPNVGHDI